jgi:phosphoserine phosphatase RsbU/P
MIAAIRVRLLTGLFLIAFCATLCAANHGSAPVFVAKGLGKGTVELSGPWEFQTGDNPAWSSPELNLDDPSVAGEWEHITAEKPWGAQEHPAYVGYAWYRRHIKITNAPGADPDVALYIQHIDDAYEVYWNGTLIGRNGSMPPHPRGYYSQASQTFNLGPIREGILAFRVWKAPLKTSDSDHLGGFASAPVLGSPVVLAAYKSASNFEWLRSRQYTFAISSLYAVIAVLSLLGWSRDRSQRALLWMAVFSCAPVAVLLLTGLQIPWSNNLALGLLQPVLGLKDVSLWFLLLWLLKLEEGDNLPQFTKRLAMVVLVTRSLNGLFMFVDWSDPGFTAFAQVASGLLTAIFTVTEVYPLLLVALAIRNGALGKSAAGLRERKRLPAAHWLVAGFAFLKEMIFVARIASSQGSRFTHWTLADRIDAPLFTVYNNPFTLQTLADTALLLAIIYAVYRYSKDTLRRQGEMEAEFKSAREVQQVLIPEALPPLAGYAVTSAYKPANEVGGDFFQIIPLSGDEKDSALVVLGDVSGKGLKAALAVSLIVGTVRTLAEATSSPTGILNALNRRLHGRLRGGFATCFVLKLTSDGKCAMANAGHLPPFFNTLEVALGGALPLGIVQDADYEEYTAELQVGDHIVLYTDGLLEARTRSGELFGFKRLSKLVEHRPNAEQMTAVAQEFGQEDDITVVTITRLEVGVESTTQLVAPELRNVA